MLCHVTGLIEQQVLDVYDYRDVYTSKVEKIDKIPFMFIAAAAVGQTGTQKSYIP